MLLIKSLVFNSLLLVAAYSTSKTSCFVSSKVAFRIAKGHILYAQRPCFAWKTAVFALKNVCHGKRKMI